MAKGRGMDDGSLTRGGSALKLRGLGTGATWWLQCVASTLLFAAGSMAHAEVDTAPALALVAKTGMLAQLDGLESQLRATMTAKYSVAGGRGNASAVQMQALYEAIGRAYNKDRMIGVVTNMMARKISPADLGDIDGWYASPSGRAVEVAEQRAAADKQPQDVQVRDGLKALQRATPQRQGLIADLVKATRLAEEMTDFVLGSALAMQAGAAISDPTIPPMSVEKLREAVTQQRPSFPQEMAQVALSMSAKTYEPVADEDLAAYIGFVKSLPGKHFYDAATSSLEAAMNSAALSMGRELGRMRSGQR